MQKGSPLFFGDRKQACRFSNLAMQNNTTRPKKYADAFCIDYFIYVALLLFARFLFSKRK